MPIGVGAAMLIGSAVAGGTAVAGAKIQSNAAKNAQQQQQQATNQALAVQRQALQPYQDIGQRGLQQLQNPAFSQPYTQVFGGGSNGAQAFGGMAPPQGPPPQGMQGPPPQMPQGPPQGPPPGSLGAMGAGQPGPGMGGQPQAPQGGAAGMMVRVQKPDGGVVSIPAQMLPQALANGGRRVG